MKIAFDENVPSAMVRAFQLFAKENQFRRRMAKFEFKSAMDYTPKPGDPDYLRKNDVPWLKRFAEDGGKVVISGNTDMKNQNHERLALIECGFVVIFFEPQWSNWVFFRKCALLLNWWPKIESKIKRAKPGSFYHIPCNWVEDGKLRRVSNQDPKMLKIERKQRGARRRRAKTQTTPASPGPLWDRLNQTKTAKEAKKPKKDDTNNPGS